MKEHVLQEIDTGYIHKETKEFISFKDFEDNYVNGEERIKEN